MAGKTGKPAQRHDLNEIDRALRDRVAELVEYFRPGVPVVRGKRTWRFGRKGALAVEVSGPECGRIVDFERDPKGKTPLGFIREERGGDWSDARAFALSWLGWPSDGPPPAEKPRPQPKAAPSAPDPDRAEKSALAVRQWIEARPIVNTRAEKYLRRRGLSDWPENVVRYHPAFRAYPGDRDPLPAIVFPVTDPRGRVVAVQAVRLTRDGRKITGRRAKTSLGPIGDGFLRFPGTGDLHIAEGPETALSIWQATGAPVVATLGPITARRIEAAPVPAGRAFVICGDAADAGSPAAIAFAGAVTAARARGVLFKLAVPVGKAGTDWNDIAQRDGVAAVSDAIEAAPWTLPEGWARARYQAPTGSIAEARAATATAFQRWGAGVLPWWVKVEAERPPAPVSLVRVPTGIGKSYAARQEAVALVRELRAAGDGRAVVIAVPTHKLGTEYLTELRKIAGELRVAAYRGRKALDPEALPELMCRRAKEAEELARVGGDVQTQMCKRGEAECPFFRMCGYQRQRKAEADVWIVPHAALWRAPPRQIEPAALIVDESPADGVFGGFGPPARLSLDELQNPLMSSRYGDGVAADLAAQTAPLARALRATPAGRIDLRKVNAERVTAEDMAEARRTVLRFKYDPKVTPDDPDETVAAEIARIGEHNRGIFHRARLFKAVSDALAAGQDDLPGIRRETVRSQDGLTVEAVRLRWRNEIAPGWAVPTILADATADPEIMRELWPALGEVVQIEANTPNVTIRQITDHAFGAASLFPDPKAGTRAVEFADRNRARLARYIEARAATFAPGKVLVIAQKETIARMRDSLPANVETAHYQALAGLDQWRDVRAIVIVGRPMPTPSAVELRAEVLAGRPVRAVPGWYERTPASLNLRGIGAGPAVFAKGAKGNEGVAGTDRHPDALAEALRWQVCEAELLQAIGRGRGVNRKASDPLAVDLLTNVPLPLAVDEAGPLAGFMPHPLEMMATRGVIVPNLSAKGAWGVVAEVLSDLFPSCEAARMAMARSREHIPIEDTHRDMFASARVKAWSCRYAVAVRLSARTRAEAEALLSRTMPGAELLDFTPPPSADDAEWRQVREVTLIEIETDGETAALQSLTAKLIAAHSVGRFTTGAKSTYLWARTRGYEAALFRTCADPPPAHPRL